MMSQSFIHMVWAVCLGLGSLTVTNAQAADEAPDAFIQRLTSDVVETIKSDKTVRAGNIAAVVAVVDSKVMPNLNFQRMTASAVGPSWRRATPEQQAKLQDEFKTLLVRTYSGALSQVNEHMVIVKPVRYSAEDADLVVRTEVKGRGEPIQLDYRLERTPGQGAGWKIYNLNVLGVWLVDTYRTQFAQEINARGIEGLIAALAEKNRANGKKG